MRSSLLLITQPCVLHTEDWRSIHSVSVQGLSLSKNFSFSPEIVLSLCPSFIHSILIVCRLPFFYHHQKTVITVSWTFLNTSPHMPVLFHPLPSPGIPAHAYNTLLCNFLVRLDSHYTLGMPNEQNATLKVRKQ